MGKNLEKVKEFMKGKDVLSTEEIAAGTGVNKNSVGGLLNANVKLNKHFVRISRGKFKLITPKGGLVLDPFIGSGTTGVACAKLGFNFVGIERDAEYIKIAEARIKEYMAQTKLKTEGVE